VCVCMYVCMYVCVCVYICVYDFILTLPFTPPTHTHTRTSLHEYAHRRGQELYEKQDLTAEDVERLNSARIALDEQMTTMMTRRAEAEKRAWKQEIAQQKCVKELEELVDKFNALLADLGSHAAMARALRQADVTLRVDASSPEHPIAPDIKSHVGPVLRSLHDQLESRVQQLQTETLSARDQITRIEDAATEKEEDLTQVERSIAVLEQQYLQDKEVRDCDFRWCFLFQREEEHKQRAMLAGRSCHAGFVLTAMMPSSACLPPFLATFTLSRSPPQAMEAENKQVAVVLQELDDEILHTRQATNALLGEESRCLEALRAECVRAWIHMDLHECVHVCFGDASPASDRSLYQGRAAGPQACHRAAAP
jgi:hypothetical protein